MAGDGGLVYISERLSLEGCAHMRVTRRLASQENNETLSSTVQTKPKQRATWILDVVPKFKKVKTSQYGKIGLPCV